MKRGRALIDPAAVMAVEVVAVAAMVAAAVVAMAVAGLATRTVIAVARATTANRAGNDLRGISPTPGSPAEHLGWGGTVREGSETKRQESDGAHAFSSTLAFCLPAYCRLLTADCLLFSNGRRNLQGQPLAPAHDFDFVFLSGFHLAQHVGVIVNVLHFASGQLHNLVAG